MEEHHAELASSPTLRAASTFGIACMALVSLETMAAALCWSLQGLFGLPSWLPLTVFILLSLPSLWITVWVALRNWHVEKRLERGLEIDEPIWSIAALAKRGSGAQ